MPQSSEFYVTVHYYITLISLIRRRIKLWSLTRVQIGQLVDVGRGEGAALALLRGGAVGVPHVKVDDRLAAALERLQQRDRAIRADQRKANY